MAESGVSCKEEIDKKDEDGACSLPEGETQDDHQNTRIDLIKNEQCPQHDKEMEYYCITHSCDCCENCVEHNHTECRLYSLANLTAKFNSVLVRASKLGTDLEQGDLEDVKRKLDEMQGRGELDKSTIQSFFKELNRKVEETEKALLEELEDLAEEELGAASTTNPSSSLDARTEPKIR